MTLVTPAAQVSDWTVHTMEQCGSSRRLLERGVTLVTGHALVGAGGGRVLIACTFTGRERELPGDALVLVTARLPRDVVAEELHARTGEWAAAGLRTVRAVGDAWAPGTIASAVWDGRRYAEELDAEPAGDAVPFRREVVALAPTAAGGRGGG